jgi:hypothetical protein
MTRTRALRLCQQLLAQRTAACQTQSITASAARSFSSMPEPVHEDSPVNRKDGKVLHPELLNENMRKCQYAVRGELYLRAEELRQAGKEIIFTNGAPLQQGDRVACPRPPRPHGAVKADVYLCWLQWATPMHLEPSQSRSRARYRL